MKLNSLVELDLFRKSCLFEIFRNCPLGFVDAGASGGVHPIINPIASLVHSTSFEPDHNAYKTLLKQYASNNPFAEISIHNAAIGAQKGLQDLYMTKSLVNSSLLEPNQDFALRYSVNGFEVVGHCEVITDTLDGLLYNECILNSKRLAEFVKLDCQGIEYDILIGAEQTMAEQSSVLYLEVGFTKLYKKQKVFADVDRLLQQRGYSLYGLYPHYISGNRLNRRTEGTEERIIWADALYFKDPLENKLLLSLREIAVILLGALLTRYYDYALELSDCYFSASDAEDLRALIHYLADYERIELELDARNMAESLATHPDKVFLFAKKFIDRNGGNSNLDFMKI